MDERLEAVSEKIRMGIPVSMPTDDRRPDPAEHDRSRLLWRFPTRQQVQDGEGRTVRSR